MEIMVVKQMKKKILKREKTKKTLMSRLQVNTVTAHCIVYT